MTKTATRTQVIAATAFLAVSSVAAAAAFKFDRTRSIVPSASVSCMDIQLLPAIGPGNEAQYNTIQRYKMVCESVGCNLTNLEQQSFSTTGYNPSRTYNATNKRCVGTPSANSCPAVGGYILANQTAETGRQSICQSFSGCQFESGQDPTGLPHAGLNDTCTRSQTASARAPGQQGQNIVPTGPTATAQAPGQTPQRFVQNCPPPASMVAWWPGNGDARDVVGGFDGLALGNTTYAPGREGQAFAFPGGYQSGVIINPGNSSLSPTGNFTVMGWVYQSSGGDIMSGRSGIHLFTRSDDVSQFTTWLGSIAPDWIDTDGNGIRDGEVTIPENEWVHIAGVLEGTTMRLYHGGTLVGSYTWSAGTPTPSDGTWSLGNNLNGKLDNVMFFNRALSGTEIRNLSEGNCVPTPPPPPTSCIASPTGMIAWWPAEGNTEDAVGNHDGQLTQTMTYAEGKVGQAFWNPVGNNFSSYNRAHMEVADVTDLALSGEYTVMAWVKATHPSGDVALKRGSNYRLGFNGGDPEFRAPFHSTMAAGTPYGYRFPAGQWVHLTGVKEAGESRLYIDGVLSEIIEFDEQVVGTWPVVIGEIMGTDNSGGVDEAMIFNRALTQAEIRNIVLAGSYGVCRP